MNVTSSLQTADGTKIVYDIHGNCNSRDRVVLIHSLAMDRTFWQPVIERLVYAGVCAVAFDCRGHGASDKPEGVYTMELFAADIRDLLDSLGWPEAVAAGCSMGGSAALTLAVDRPDLVSGLCLIDTTAWFGLDAMQNWSQRADAVLDKGLAPQVDVQVARWFGEAFRRSHPELVRSCVETFLRNDVKSYAETCRMLGKFDIRHALPRLKIPVGIVVGEGDQSTPPAMSEVIKAAIPHASFRLLANARHLTPLELPDDIAGEILAIVDEVGGSHVQRT